MRNSLDWLYYILCLCMHLVNGATLKVSFVHVFFSTASNNAVMDLNLWFIFDN